MKRDMDFIRELLITVEAKPDNSEYRLVPGKASDQEIYHVELMVEAGLIKANPYLFDDGHKEWGVERLTWKGHEFLDAARDQSRWNQAKNIAGEKAGSVTFDVLTSLLTQLMRQAVGL